MQLQRIDGRNDNVKTVYPPNTVCGEGGSGVGIIMFNAELQIRGGTKANSKIIFLTVFIQL